MKCFKILILFLMTVVSFQELVNIYGDSSKITENLTIDVEKNPKKNDL